MSGSRVAEGTGGWHRPGRGSGQSITGIPVARLRERISASTSAGEKGAETESSGASGTGALERWIRRKIEAEYRNADIMRGFILDGSHFVVQQYDPAPKTMPPTVKIPGADIGPLANDPTREAVDSMRGYSYQVLCSVLAWVDLSEGELLFLEGAEDFDHIAGDTATATQVRDTRGSGNITLRSKDTLQALKPLLVAPPAKPPIAESGFAI